MVCKWIRSGQVDLAHVQVTSYASSQFRPAAFPPFVTLLFTRTEANSEARLINDGSELPHTDQCDGVRDSTVQRAAGLGTNCIALRRELVFRLQ